MLYRVGMSAVAEHLRRGAGVVIEQTMRQLQTATGSIPTMALNAFNVSNGSTRVRRALNRELSHCVRFRPEADMRREWYGTVTFFRSRRATMFSRISYLVLAFSFALAFAKSDADTRLYFPRGALDPSSTQSDDFDNNWYSTQLRAMAEPVLAPSGATHAYRFTWLRTFHHPIAIRVVAENGQFKLFATELDGAGGYSPGVVLRKKSVSLSSEQFEELEALILRNDFWNLAPHEETMGPDGSEWIVEAATDRYHAVARWTPHDGALREIGERFLSLAGWSFDSREMY